MAHELDYQTGKPAIAYIGEAPWHQLGFRLQPGAPLDTWQIEAGLDWEAKRAGVEFDRMIVDTDGTEKPIRARANDHIALYRSDTGTVLSIVSKRYQPVQPKQIIEFYRDLTEKYGFQLETAGSLKDGKKIWALANTKNVTMLRDGDAVKGYLLLCTSFDGSMSTQARFTSVRVVCNNTISIATEHGRADVVVPHSTQFNADEVKIGLKLGDAWEKFSEQATRMTQRIVNKEETTRFLLDVYHGLATDEDIRAFKEQENAEATMAKFSARMSKALFESPGAHMASARGTLWGVLNAVTHDIDYDAPARSQENRLNSAWFGRGNTIKDRAWTKALAMVA